MNFSDCLGIIPENQDFKVIDKSIIFENPFTEEPLYFSAQDQALSIPYIILLIVFY